jgi:hypothetical protein
VGFINSVETTLLLTTYDLRLTTYFGQLRVGVEGKEGKTYSNSLPLIKEKKAKVLQT